MHTSFENQVNDGAKPSKRDKQSMQLVQILEARQGDLNHGQANQAPQGQEDLKHVQGRPKQC